jgi:A/G-specific adenine glycosylase
MKISNILTDWYKKNSRNLPWRETSDPYLIWLSEVILQQTRVDQGLDYYYAFSRRYPTVKDLAEASEEEVLKLWQGLGYYSRARNLHAAARQVMGHFGGRFPATYSDLLSLKGVGDYTAAAVASIAGGEDVAVVDGNVARVISRLFAIGEPVNSAKGHREVRTVAAELLDRKDPGTHNQAMMEFGALQCVPGAPDCSVCPVAAYCVSRKEGTVDRYPVKRRKAAVTSRYFTYFILLGADSTYLVKRTNDDIWKSMYEFPMVETAAAPAEAQFTEMLSALTGWSPEAYTITRISPEIIHQLSHRKIHARMVHAERSGILPEGPGEWIRIGRKEIGNYPVPRLIDRYLDETVL